MYWDDDDHNIPVYPVRYRRSPDEEPPDSEGWAWAIGIGFAVLLATVLFLVAQMVQWEMWAV